jgi:hypothetical protein
MEANHVEVRNLTKPDMQELQAASADVQQIGKLNAWDEQTIDALLTRFPDGQICVCVDGKVVGCTFSLIIDYAKFGDPHTYDEITSKMTLTNHDSDGDVLYGIEVFIDHYRSKLESLKAQKLEARSPKARSSKARKLEISKLEARKLIAALLF